MRVLDRASRGVLTRLAGSVVAGLLAVVLVAAGVMFGLPALGFSVWSVSGTSMEPTFRDGSILMLKSSGSSVARGDVVVIDRPSSWRVVQVSGGSSVKNDGAGDKSKNKKSLGSRFGRSALLKRAVAVPGDTLSFDGKAFLVNGSVVYSTADNDYECSALPAGWSHRLSADELFVMGDNARVSLDSRKVVCTVGPDSEASPFLSVSGVRAHGDSVFNW